MLEQGTEQWLRARCGFVTASKVSDAMAKKGTAARANYMAQVMAERVAGEPAESFSSAAMQWGTETEPQARAMYGFVEDQEVLEVGFVHHPSIDWLGASPDGLVGDDGLLEIKCPNTATHFKTLLGGKIDPQYMRQMQVQMACTERKWCDFVSFDPRLTPAKQYYCERIERDDKMIAEIAAAVTEFLGEVEQDLAKLEQLYPEQKKAA